MEDTKQTQKLLIEPHLLYLEWMNVIAVLQARLSSNRLPGKVLKPILGIPMLLHQIRRIQRAKKIDSIIVATSQDPSDDPIADLCQSQQIPYYRGSLENVLERFYQAALSAPGDPKSRHVVRLTGDCPLFDPQLADAIISTHIEKNADYTSNTLTPTYPDGLDIEVMTLETLKTAHEQAQLPSEREHVTPYIYRKGGNFKLFSYLSPGPDLSPFRWVVDEPSDLEFVTAIYEALYPANPSFDTPAILELLRQRPELQSINSGYKRNEGYERSLLKDQNESHRLSS